MWLMAKFTISLVCSYVRALKETCVLVVSDMRNTHQVVFTSNHIRVANAHEEFLSCSLVLASNC